MAFITARLALLAEADPADRKLMRLDSPALDKESVVYLLTIGTVPHLQRKVSNLGPQGMIQPFPGERVIAAGQFLLIRGHAHPILSCQTPPDHI